MIKNILWGAVLAALFVAWIPYIVVPAITELGGLAVAQSATQWNNLKDAAQGDGLTNGIAAVGPMGWNGSTFDRLQSISGQLKVSLAGIVAASDDGTNPTNKLPVLPCKASVSIPALTNGNIEPCLVTTGGAQFIQVGGGYPGSGLVAFGVFQTQALTLFNSSTTGAANTVVTATIAAAANVRGMVYTLDSSCSAGTSTLSVTDGGTTIWTSQTGEITTARFSKNWPVPLTGSTNSAVVITLATCGVGNSGTLQVQASRF